MTIIFEHNVPFRHWPFSLVTTSSLIFRNGLTHIKPFLHVLCYFSSVIGPLHVWKLWCKSEWFEDASKFSWIFLTFWKGHGTGYRTFLKKPWMSFRIFRKVITKVGPFLINLMFDFSLNELTHLQLCHFWKIINVCCCNERALVLIFSQLPVCSKKASASNTRLIIVLRKSDMLETTFQLLKVRLLLLLDLE